VISVDCTASVSTGSGESVLNGATAMLTMLKYEIIIEVNHDY